MLTLDARESDALRGHLYCTVSVSPGLPAIFDKQPHLLGLEHVAMTSRLDSLIALDFCCQVEFVGCREVYSTEPTICKYYVALSETYTPAAHHLSAHDATKHFALIRLTC